MPSLELLAVEAGRASRRHPIRAVAQAILCEPAHPLVDSASLAACTALDPTRAAAITAAFARGLEVPLAETPTGDAAVELPMGKEYLYQWSGRAWLLYQHAWWRAER